MFIHPYLAGQRHRDLSAAAETSRLAAAARSRRQARPAPAARHPPRGTASPLRRPRPPVPGRQPGKTWPPREGDHDAHSNRLLPGADLDRRTAPPGPSWCTGPGRGPGPHTGTPPRWRRARGLPAVAARPRAHRAGRQPITEPLTGADSPRHRPRPPRPDPAPATKPTRRHPPALREPPLTGDRHETTSATSAVSAASWPPPDPCRPTRRCPLATSSGRCTTSPPTPS
jgi:hypothetical protein